MSLASLKVSLVSLKVSVVSLKVSLTSLEVSMVSLVVSRCLQCATHIQTHINTWESERVLARPCEFQSEF